ncbi:DUF5132 domain-containing protein [Methylobacterium sp. P31]
MALVEDMAKAVSGSGAGVVGGVGALLLAPIVLPLVGRVIRPVATAALRSGIVLYRDVEYATSELVAEVRSEMVQDAPGASTARSKKLGGGRKSVREPKPA